MDRTDEWLRELAHLGIQRAQPEAMKIGADLPQCKGRRFVIAVGKAAPGMMRSFLRDHPIDAGLLVTRQSQISGGWPSSIQVLAGGHPVPTPGSFEAGSAALSMAQSVGPDDQFIVLISGGTSALLEVPPPDISRQDMITVYETLLNSGWPIGFMNRLRRLFSGIKGGRLAYAARQGTVWTYVLSDVPGDHLPWVGSGPTLACDNDIPIDENLLRDFARLLPEQLGDTLRSAYPKLPSTSDLPGGQVTLIGSAALSLAAIETVLTSEGYEVENLGDALEGDAHVVGRDHAQWAKSMRADGRRAALLSGGETTIKVVPGGRGGCNKAYLLALALEMGDPGVHAIAIDTDGIDGSEDDAGATLTPGFLNGTTLDRNDAMNALETSNSYEVFDAIGRLIKTGPTGTNVNDIRIVLTEPLTIG